MKRILAAILCNLLLLVSLTVPVRAEERTTYRCGDCEYALLEDGSAELLRYYGTERCFQIPDKLDGYIVTAIGDKAFADCAELNEVTIPEGVTVIGYQAFDNGAEVTLVLEGEREFIDKTLRCKTCGQNFVFPAEEQALYAWRGFHDPPTRCEDCRNALKNSGNSGTRKSYTAVCALCGKEFQLPFEPKDDRPYYCSDCFDKLYG